MPETPVKETRRPDLHLPEIKRDEIIRALSEIRLPDVDLSKIDLSRLDLSKIERPKVELPDVDLRRLDVRRAMEDVAIRAGVRERTRSRWPLVAGLLIAAGVGVWALLRRPAVRAQVEEAAQKARERIEQMRLEREADDGSLSLAEIESAVGESTDGSEPVAVGPGPKPRRSRAKPKDVAEAFDAFEETPSQV
jgi:hypothetical protein